VTPAGDPPAPRLILASASPRRLELLARIGVVPDAIIPADVDETPKRGELPVAYARRIAAEKAGRVSEPGALVLAADTVVAVGRRILGKAETADEARAALSLLSGRRHRVFSAVTLVDSAGTSRHRLSTSIVTFKRLSEQELEAYLESGEYRGKAGGYAIQGLAGSFVQKLSGSYTNVVGLPLTEVVNMLVGEGFPIHFNWIKIGESDAE
jgi:septum formation protein